MTDQTTDQDLQVGKFPARKVQIDSDLLTPGDFRRARVALGGSDPWERLRGHQEDRCVLIAWCQLSRDDPTLTMDDVDAWPFGTYVEVVPDDEDDRPLPELSDSNGLTPAAANGSRPRKSRSSAASTD